MTRAEAVKALEITRDFYKHCADVAVLDVYGDDFRAMELKLQEDIQYFLTAKIENWFDKEAA